MGFMCHSQSGNECCIGCKDAAAIMDRHEKIVLQFSGGKDSMASLLFLRPWWDKITTMWVNTGAAFPEMLDLIDTVKKMVPHFVEIKTNQPAYISVNGIPGDVVPVNHTKFGQNFTGSQKTMVSAYLDCCGTNVSLPLAHATKQFGATLIVRGQKDADDHKSPIKSGHILDGAEYFFPVEDWTNAEVFEYLAEQDFEIPAFYSLKATSLDCWNCTAYCADHADKLAYMKTRHPDKHRKLLKSLTALREAIGMDLSHLDNLLEETNGIV